MRANVTAKIRSSRFSLPGSCWGFRYSAKVTRFLDCAVYGVSGVRCGLTRGTMFLYDGIVPALYKGMAAQQPGHRFKSAADDAEAFDRFHRVLRTGRNVATSGQEHRRNRPLVASQQVEHDALGKIGHEINFKRPLSAFRALRSSRHPDSFRRAFSLLLRTPGAFRSPAC